MCSVPGNWMLSVQLVRPWRSLASSLRLMGRPSGVEVSTVSVTSHLP